MSNVKKSNNFHRPQFQMLSIEEYKEFCEVIRNALKLAEDHNHKASVNYFRKINNYLQLEDKVLQRHYVNTPQMLAQLNNAVNNRKN